MTREEKIIISAYTGILEQGIEFADVREYTDNKLKKKVWVNTIKKNGEFKTYKELMKSVVWSEYCKLQLKGI